MFGITARFRQDCGVALLCSDAPEAERPAASALQHAAVRAALPPRAGSARSSGGVATLQHEEF